jgi:hypothetical protein
MITADVTIVYHIENINSLVFVFIDLEVLVELFL